MTVQIETIEEQEQEVEDQPEQKEPKVEKEAEDERVVEQTQPDVEKVNLNVKIQFGWTVHKCGEHLVKEIVVQVPKDGSSSVASLKKQISELEGIPPKAILLEFMDKTMGREHEDHEYDEEACKLADFSILSWVEQFPEWNVLCRNMPPGPVDPYVAIKRTVALQMNRDPDEEVEKARKDGSLYHIDTWEEHKKRYGVE